MESRFCLKQLTESEVDSIMAGVGCLGDFI